MCVGDYAQHYLESQLLSAKDRAQLIFSDTLLAEQTPDLQGQFNVLAHRSCWVHAERGLRRLQCQFKSEVHHSQSD